MIVYKFVKWDVNPAQEMTFESFKQCYTRFHSQVNNALNGYLKIGGWCYDFRD